jgi:hypothetical protein
MKLSGKTYVGSAIDLTRRFRSYFSLAHFFFFSVWSPTFGKGPKKKWELRNGNSVICS